MKYVLEILKAEKNELKATLEEYEQRSKVAKEFSDESYFINAKSKLNEIEKAIELLPSEISSD